MPKKENFPWEAVAIIAKVLEENSEKHEPGNWRTLSVNEHEHHAHDHLDELEFDWYIPDRETTEDHLAHALTRLAMAVAVRETGYEPDLDKADPGSVGVVLGL